jgi:hypothetical protein
MSKARQRAHINRITNERYQAQSLALASGLIVYGLLALLLNFLALRAAGFEVSAGTLIQLAAANLLLLGIVLNLMNIPVYGRYLYDRVEFAFKRELLAHFLSRPHVPASHRWLPVSLAGEMTAHISAVLHCLHLILARRIPYLHSRRKTPFLFFQQANLLVAP